MSLTIEQRKDILNREISKLSKQGWRIQSQTDTTAQLVKPKSFSCLWATLWFLLFGIGLLIYLFYYWGKKEDTLFLSVDEQGHIRRK